MRIGLSIKSPILEKTLAFYLRKNLAPLEDCDVVISDSLDEREENNVCLIDFSAQSDILRPFCAESLKRDLEKFYAKFSALSRAKSAFSAEKLNNILDLGELESLKKSIDLINETPETPQNSDLHEEIDALAQELIDEFKQKLYAIISKNAK